MKYHNLRKELSPAGHQQLMAVAPMAQRIVLRNWKPLARFCGGKFIIARGENLAVSDLTGAPAAIASDCGDALCAFADGRDGIVMCGQGAVRFDGTVATPVRRDFPAVSIVAENVAVYEHLIPEMKLKGTVPVRSERREIAAQFTEAYVSMAANAAADGLFVQPCLARALYYDAAGNLLHAGPPVMVSPADGPQFTKAVALTSSASGTVDACALSLKAFRITARFEGKADGRVASVVIALAPQFHPLSTTATPELFDGRSGSGVAARVLMPGGLKAASGQAKAMVARVVAGFDDVAVQALTVRAPFTGSAMSCTVPQPRTDAVEEVRDVERLLRRKVVAAAPEEVLLDAPHSFVARHVASDGATVLWGNLSAIRYDGYPLHDFAAQLDAADYRYTVTVRFAGGHTGVVRTADVQGAAAVTALSPVLVYPSPDAVEMCVMEYHGGVTRKTVLPLEPDPSRRFSMYISDDFKPLVPAAAASAQIVELAAPEDNFPGKIAVCDAARPLSVRRIVGIPGEVRAMSALGITDGAWEFGRSRFVLASVEDLYSLAVSSAGVSLRTLCNAGVRSPSALVSLPHGVAAATDSGLVCVDATSRRAVCVSRTRFSALAYSAGAGELLARNSDGDEVFGVPDDSMRLTQEGTRTVPQGETVNICGRAFILSEQGLGEFSAMAAPTAALVNVSFSTVITPGRMPVSLKSVAVDFSCAECDLTVTVDAVYSRAEVNVATVDVSGKVSAPLRIPLAMRAAPAYRISLNGYADTSFRLSPELIF